MADSNFLREEQIWNLVLDRVNDAIKVVVNNPTNDNDHIEVVLRDENGDPYSANNLFPSGLYGHTPTSQAIVMRLSELGVVNSDGVYHATNNTLPSSSGLIAATRNALNTVAQMANRITSVISTDGLRRSLDIALHDSNGNPFVFLASALSNCLQIQVVGNDGLYRMFVDSAGRASVNANVTFPESVYEVDNLRNGSSAEMNVNGSVTPASYRYTPTGEVKYIECLSMQLEDNATFSLTDFGGIGGALANGVQINVRTKGQLFTITNLRDNCGVLDRFNEDQILERRSAGLGTVNLLRGTLQFRNRIVLDPAMSDYIEVLIRDNLSGLTLFRVAHKSWRLVG
jgi:hypothetical protein